MNLSCLYNHSYVSSTYGDKEDLLKSFKKIISLPPEASDNEGRIKRVNAWAKHHLPIGNRKLLDIGSGLGVFPWRMQREGWTCTAIDTDPRQIAHLRNIGINAVRDDFSGSAKLGQYDLISFNKVLEHIRDPISMLAMTHNYLAPGGLVYIEIPDGEIASIVSEASSREEFYIEHLHVFSMTSTTLLSVKAGLTIIMLERVNEPSSKYTIRCLMQPLSSLKIS